MTTLPIILPTEGVFVSRRPTPERAGVWRESRRPSHPLSAVSCVRWERRDAALSLFLAQAVHAWEAGDGQSCVPLPAVPFRGPVPRAMVHSPVAQAMSSEEDRLGKEKYEAVIGVPDVNACLRKREKAGPVAACLRLRPWRADLQEICRSCRMAISRVLSRDTRRAWHHHGWRSFSRWQLS